MESARYGILDAVYVCMTDESNPKAMVILKRWSLMDAAGREHEVVQHVPLNPAKAREVKRKRPDNWRELEHGEFIARVTQPAPQPVKEDYFKWWSLA